MSQIRETFRALASDGSRAFIPYLCAGDPDKRFSLELMHRLSRAGADIIEIGLPFTDPVADGPVIQAAMNRSLAGGFKCADLFELVRQARQEGIRRPIVAMTYYNPVLQMGSEKFCDRLVEAGADAVLAVDLPPEESHELDEACRTRGLDVVRLIAPSTTDSRMDYILSRASGFVYVVSVSGTTGAREVLPPSAESLVKRVVKRSELPVALGFGISTPEQVRAAISCGASGVVEGSKLISIYAESLPDRESALDRVERHAREMKNATFRARGE
ncbi:MAG: tryptophan synthase subunit alpha [Thermoplasmata archaeon]